MTCTRGEGARAAGPSVPFLSSGLRIPGDLAALLGVDLSDEQLVAATAPLEPGVIVAGAGSGKTTVMAARVVWLVGTGQVRPGEVLGLTFTTKAAAELGTGVRARLAAMGHPPAGPNASRDSEPADEPDEPDEPMVVTYHAYAGSLLVEHGLRIGLEPDRRVVADATRYQLAARAVASFEGLREHLSISLPTLIAQVVRLDNELSDHLVGVSDVHAHGDRLRGWLAGEKQIGAVRDAVAASRTRDELLDLVQAYRQAKDDAGVAEFADQMAGAARLAERCPEVGEEERARHRVVLLDEYQDTSVSQRRMLQALFSGTASAGGTGHPVTAVGDPCQAIYGWRGASVDNLDQFPRHFPRFGGEPARRFGLTVNRRCASTVLAAANDLAGPLYATHPGVAPLAARPDAPVGRVRVALHDTVADEVAAVVDDVQRVGRALAADGAGGWSDVAVLVRDGTERGALAAAMRGRGVPVEVVGLTGLLGQPEVGDVLATLRCVASLTANSALLRLLTGPRWRIGPRDLALLGARARELARAGPVAANGLAHDLHARLDAAVAGVDSTEVVSLGDALDDPGARPFSTAARTRFAALSGELDGLRRFAGEPLVDLVRKVVDVLGVELELAVAPGPGADLARDNLALFVDAVAGFAGTDPTAGLMGLLAYLDAELEHQQGMAVADPGAADSVKLLTVHAAKGLEWRAVVLPFLSRGVFPTGTGRPRWERRGDVVPASLRGDAEAQPRLIGWDKAARDAYAQEHAEQREREERRLAYVAVTRARELVVASGHWWGRTQKRPRGPSPYLDALRVHAGPDGAPWAAGPADDAVNPLVAAQVAVPFPGRLDGDVLARRRAVAADVRAELARLRAAGDAPPAAEAPAAGMPDDVPDLAALDAEIDLLVAEARAATSSVREVALPLALSATRALQARTDPAALANELARPLPRRPSQAASYGVRFHAWVQAHVGQQQLLGPDELPGRADRDIGDDADLAELVEAFQAGPFASQAPVAVEAPFQLELGGQVLRGRIDAIYPRAGGGFDVLDWKTGRGEDGDPLQLAVYRLAWAELHRLDLATVGAAFCYVRTGRVVAFDDLPGRAGLAAALFGGLSR